jgi:hypothetical protein
MTYRQVIQVAESILQPGQRDDEFRAAGTGYLPQYAANDSVEPLYFSKPLRIVSSSFRRSSVVRGYDILSSSRVSRTTWETMSRASSLCNPGRVCPTCRSDKLVVGRVY